MTDDQYKELTIEHEQMLKTLTRLTDDHEKRIRMIERVIFGILAIAGMIEFLRKGI